MTTRMGMAVFVKRKGTEYEQSAVRCGEEKVGLVDMTTKEWVIFTFEELLEKYTFVQQPSESYASAQTQADDNNKRKAMTNDDASSEVESCQQSKTTTAKEGEMAASAVSSASFKLSTPESTDARAETQADDNNKHKAMTDDDVPSGKENHKQSESASGEEVETAAAATSSTSLKRCTPELLAPAESLSNKDKKRKTMTDINPSSEAKSSKQSKTICEEGGKTAAKSAMAVSASTALKRRPPIRSKSDVSEETYLQVVVYVAQVVAYMSISTPKNKKPYIYDGDGLDRGSLILRQLVIKGTATAFDLVKAVLCAFGLESNRVRAAPYERQTNQGKLDLGDKNFCTLQDLENDEYEKGLIKGIRYAKTTYGNLPPMTLKELKSVKLVQLLDKPHESTGAEPANGIRDDIQLMLTLPDRDASLTRPSAPAALYNFFVELEAIGSKEHLRPFQNLMPVRCTHVQGQVFGGTEENMHEINLRFAAGKKMAGLCFATGDPTEDFWKCRYHMSAPIIKFEEYETQDDDRPLCLPS